MLSKACYVATYRRKLEELASLPEVDLSLIVPPYWRLRNGKALLEKGFDQGYEMIVENPLLNGHHHLHIYPNIAQHLKRIRPDLLHLDEEPYDFVTLHALRTAKKLGIKVLFFTWQNIQRHFPTPFNLLESYVLRHADAAIAGSMGAAQVLRDKGFYRPLYVVPQFGVDLKVYHHLPPVNGTATVKEPLHIGYVGRLVKEKGLLTLLKAVAGLKGNWRLTLLGNGPLLKILEGESRSLGIEQQTMIKEPIPSTDIPEHLSQLDVLVLPSTTTTHWKEQFGRVLIEAMACEVPVIGSDSGAIPEVMGDAGLVFPEGDAEGLQNQLQRLMDSEDLRRKLMSMGKGRVINHYTQKRVAEQTYKVYGQMLGSLPKIGQ